VNFRVNNWRTIALAVAVLLVSALLSPALGGVAQAVQVAQPKLVSDTPSAFTPNILDGRVDAIVQIGSTIVLGGQFSQVQEAGSSVVLSRTDILAFNADTGQISTTFQPVVNDEVLALAVAPDGKSVYIAGDFLSLNGKTTNHIVAQVNISDGSTVSTFKSPKLDGGAFVEDLRLSNGRLWIAGGFLTVNGVAQASLATLNPTTGALDPYMSLPISGLHNGGKQRLDKIDITPDGSRLVGIGNFTSIAGRASDQIFMLNLTGPSAVLANWQTNFYTSHCSNSFDTFMRDLDISPDGSYFVVSTTGAYGGSSSSCDQTSRWDFSATGSALTPTWTNYTGGDTTFAVAITGTAVYVGGHFRWSNNPSAGDRAGQGAVAREGLAALDPINGLPFDWDPGRTKGVGVFDMLATTTGLWIGSDTDRIGHGAYHGRIAFMPLAGGKVVASTATGSLPGTAYLAGRPTASGGLGVDDLGTRSFDGTTSAAPTAASSGGIAWSSARGATMMNGVVYYGWSDGQLYSSTFDGTTFGPRTIVNTADQIIPLTGFHTDLANATGMFFSKGRLYYTVSGQSSLYYRYFTPESNVVGAVRFTASGNLTGLDFSRTAGMFAVGNTLYVANRDDGKLRSVTLTNGIPVQGTVATLANAGTNWASRALFVYAPAVTPVDVPPVANATVTCTNLDCSLSAAGSNDSDGTITSYSWDDGDGSVSSGASTTHTFSTAGTYTLTLTVQDDGGATATSSQTVTVTSDTPPPPGSISFLGAVTSNSTATSQTVKVPASVQAGDGLVLLTTAASDSVTESAPAGWALVDNESDANQTTSVWQKVATASDAGTTVKTLFSVAAKASVQLLAYHGTAATGPVVSYSDAPETVSRAAHPAPSVVSDAPADWRLTYWADVSSTTSSWSAPAGQAVRATSFGSGGGHVSSLTVDSNSGAGSGTLPQLIATASSSSAKGSAWSIVLDAAPVVHVNVPPVAQAAVTCNGLSCSLSAAGSADSDGTIASYSWDNGDGSTSDGATATQVYSAAGTYTVELTVTDNDGATDTADQTVTVAPTPISFVGSAQSNANTTAQTVKIPAGVQSGDGLLLFTTAASGTVTETPSAGWTLVDTETTADHVTSVWQRVASSADAGATVRVTLSATAKADVQLLAYHGTAASGPVGSFAHAPETVSQAAHTSPVVSSSADSSWELTYWADISSTTSSWTAPVSQTVRATSIGAGGGHVSSLTVDSNTAVGPGSLPSLTATASAASSKATAWSLVLARS
jgi:PKD repeat protein